MNILLCLDFAAMVHYSKFWQEVISVTRYQRFGSLSKLAFEYYLSELELLF